MKKKVNKNLTSFADHLDKQYGKKGTVKRDAYEQEFEAFKLGVLIQEMRESQNLTPTKAIKHMLYCRFLKCVLLNFVSNVGQSRAYLNAYVL
jgi:hypothetical protein